MYSFPFEPDISPIFLNNNFEYHYTGRQRRYEFLSNYAIDHGFVNINQTNLHGNTFSHILVKLILNQKLDNFTNYINRELNFNIPNAFTGRTAFHLALATLNYDVSYLFN